jgi:hypothetical protein
MKYYSYLDIDWKPVAEKIKLFLEKRPELTAQGQGAWVAAPRAIIQEVPEIISMFKPLGLDIAMIGFFITHYQVGSIHTDGTTVPIRINFPILNCENTETKFYRVTGPFKEQSQLNGNGYVQYHPDHCELVDSFKLDKAVAMRVLEPHQVVSYTENLPRISCTVAFKQDLTHLLV